MSMIKEKLIKKINESNINVHSLEKKAGLKTGYIRNILLGRSENPRVFTLLAACEALNCSLNDILGIPSSNKKETSIFNGVIWKFSLYEKVLKKVNMWIEANNIKITLEKTQSYINEIYLYSMNNNDGKLDSTFAEWLLEKHNKY